MQRREMLLEYFSIVITDEGMIETLPMLLKDYSPNLDKLPLFLMRLGPQVCMQRFDVDLQSHLSNPLHYRLTGPQRKTVSTPSSASWLTSTRLAQRYLPLTLPLTTRDYSSQKRSKQRGGKSSTRSSLPCVDISLPRSPYWPGTSCK